MTRDEIIEMARQADIKYRTDVFYSQFCDGVYEDDLKAFAKLVAQAERDECAKILDANAMACHTPIMRSLLQSNAQAIRARGQA